MILRAWVLLLALTPHLVRAEASGPDVPPVAIRKAEPSYPLGLVRAGITGTVLLDFIIDTDGRVVKPKVVRSTNPAFDGAATSAILKWTFKPGVKNGHAVATHVEMPITFSLDLGNGRDGPWKFPPSGSADLPPEFRYDSPPVPVWIGPPVYPFDLLVNGTKAQVLIEFEIDPAGKTHVLSVSNTPNPEFAAATAAMVASWEFAAARKKEKPCWCHLTFKQTFDPNGRDSPPDDDGDRLLRVLIKDPSRILTDAKLLDAPLRPRYQPQPIIPPSVRAAHVKAEAVIEFVIDEAGSTELQRIVSSTNADFGWAAATATSRWQFEPPAFDGKPVDVRVRLPFQYTPHDDPQGSNGDHSNQGSGL